MRVRRGAPDDAEAIRRVFAAATSGAVPHDRFADATKARDRRVAMFVAEQGGELVGFSIARPSGDGDAGREVGEVDGLFVHPSAWGRGIGAALLHEAPAFLRREQFGEATLWTGEDNERARSLYERGGWVVDGARRSRRRRSDEVRYRRSL